MDKFIQQQNLALFKKRLAESPPDTSRELLLKLIAEEELKESPSEMGNLKPR